MQSPANKQNKYKLLIKQSGLFLFMCAVILVPIIGIKLRGWQYETRFLQVGIIVLILLLLRIAVGLILIHPTLGKRFKRFFSQSISLPRAESENKSKATSIFLICFFIFSLILPLLADQYWISVLITVLIYILLGLGLNIVIGFAGMLDLGYVAFYATGAYSIALLYQYLQLDFWISLPLSALIAAGVGALLAFPVLKMHGDYLAIVTLGFGEIIRLVMNNWTEVTGGPNGIRLIKPFITFFGLPFTNGKPNSFHTVFGLDYSEYHKPIFIYFCLLLIIFATTYLCLRLKRMPLGRSWEALREDEIACRAMGINHVKIKLAAFALGAFLGGIGGSFFATLTEFVSPTSFTFIESALVVAIVVLGGLGSVHGVIISAIVMTVLPEILRDVANARILMFGMIMVVMMIWRPRGLAIVTRPLFKTNKTK